MRTGWLLAILLTFSIVFAAAALAQTTHKKAATKNDSFAAVPLPQPYADLLKDSSQAMVVTAPDWNSVDGSLQRYEKIDGHWEQVGTNVAVVVGKNGIAWDGTLDIALPGAPPVKKEGDGRSPAGVFAIGEGFGFAPSAPDLKLPYRPLTDYIECVDDASSESYNQVVDRDEIPHPDWNSSEKMRTVDAYKEGAVVNYNDQQVPGAGSCIFMHIWKGPGHGTAGCTAMDEGKLQEMLNWLDPSKKPVLIQLPAAMYKEVKDSWKLP